MPANPNYALQVQGLDTPTSPITSDTLTPTSSLQLPKSGVQAPGPGDYTAAISSIPSLSDAYNATYGTPSQAEKTQSTLSDRILSITNDLGDKQQAQTAAEANAGLPTLNKSLTDVNGQIQSLQKEALAIPLQLQQDATGRGITAGGLQPLQTAALRNNAIKSLGLSAIAQTLQGNITLAQQQANRAVDLEFAPKQAELDYLKQAYAMNQDTLNRQDAKRSKLFEAQLADRQTQLDQQKQDKQTIQALAMAAIKNNPNNPAAQYAAQQALQAPDVNTAFALVGKYQANPQDIQSALLDQQLKRAQIAKLNADAAAAADGSNLDPSQLVAYAQQYAATGNIPTGLPKGSFGAVAQLAKEAPKQEGTIISNSTGVVPSNLSSTESQSFSAAYDLVRKLNDIKTLYQTGVGPDAAQQYQTMRGEISDLIARVRSGAALNDAELATYASKLPSSLPIVKPTGGGLPVVAIDTFANSISDKLRTALRASNTSIVGFSKVNVGDQQYTVGQRVTNAKGQTGIVNADGSITILQ